MAETHTGSPSASLPRRSVWLFNPGSSSLKWAWYQDLGDESPTREGKIINDDSMSPLQQLLEQQETDCAAVRFVHGGPDFYKPTRVDQENLRHLESVVQLAPLHNHQSLECLRALSKSSPSVKLFAVFDTEFFHSLPVSAQLYGLPRHLIQRYRIRRFGFHGFAHAGLRERWRAIVDGQDRVSSDKRVVTLQLGSGCSMAAIRGAQPVETTMGFTPNEGLLMSTRSGDIDPGLLTWLQQQEGWTPRETDRILNEESGWSGLSGIRGEFSQLLQVPSPEARETIQLFSWRVRKTLGAYHALLGGLDGVVMGGGVAESIPTFCLQLLQDLEHLGIKVAKQPPPAPGPEQPFSTLSSSDSNVLCGVAANHEFWSMLQSLRHALFESDACQPD